MFFSPTKTTFLKAIKNDQLLGIPGLTETAVTKFLPPSSATIKGHMHRERKNIHSTRKPDTEAEVDIDLHPPQEINAVCELYCFSALADTIEGTIYSDLTGKFPVRSYKRNQYIFVAYVYDANAILIRPMPNRKTTT